MEKVSIRCKKAILSQENSHKIKEETDRKKRIARAQNRNASQIDRKTPRKAKEKKKKSGVEKNGS